MQINPNNISFFSASAGYASDSDVYTWIKPLRDYFNDSSSYFSIVDDGPDAGVGAGSGGFIVKCNAKGWTYSIQRIDADTVGWIFDPLGTMQTAGSGSNFPTGSIQISQARSGSNSSLSANDLHLNKMQILEWSDAFLLCTCDDALTEPYWMMDVGRIYDPVVKVVGSNLLNNGVLWIMRDMETSFFSSTSDANQGFKHLFHMCDISGSQQWMWDTTAAEISRVVVRGQASTTTNDHGGLFVPNRYMFYEVDTGRPVGWSNHFWGLRPGGTGGQIVTDVNGTWLFSFLRNTTNFHMIPWLTGSFPIWR